MKGENIVRLYDVMETDKNFYVVLEYCPDGDFTKLLEKHGGKNYFNKFKECLTNNLLKMFLNNI